MDGHERAAQLFSQGYSCSQAVAAAFSKRFGLDEVQALRVAAAFGGGMSRAGETCGAVTGGLMIVGLLAGSTNPADKAAKARTYQMGQEFMRRFQARCGALDCRCLLGVDLSSENGPQIAHDQGLYQSVCPALVSASAEILEDLCTNP